MTELLINGNVGSGVGGTSNSSSIRICRWVTDGDDILMEIVTRLNRRRSRRPCARLRTYMAVG